MANKTDPLARTVHGGNPQHLIEKILRNRIYDSAYWKEHCFGLTASSIIDKALRVDAVGGSYSANVKPTPFICLLLKLLQIQPEKDIVIEYIRQEASKYLRALGAFYLRLTGRPAEVHTLLEPLYSDYRKLAKRSPSGWSIVHMDEFIDELLTAELCCDVTLPHLPKRNALEATGQLPPRVSALDEEIEAEAGADGGTRRGASAEAEDGSHGEVAADPAARSLVASAVKTSASSAGTSHARPSRDGPGGSTDHDWRRDGERGDSEERNRYERRGSSRRSRSPSYDRERRRDRDDRDRDYEDRRRDRVRDRERDDYRDDRYDRAGDRHRGDREREDEYYRREASRARAGDAYDNRGKYERDRYGSRNARRRASRSRSRSGERRRRSPSPRGRDERSRAERRSPSPVQAERPQRDELPAASTTSGVDAAPRRRRFEDAVEPSKQRTTTPAAAGEPTAPEGSTEYWNQMRAKLGLKPLK